MSNDVFEDSEPGNTILRRVIVKVFFFFLNSCCFVSEWKREHVIWNARRFMDDSDVQIPTSPAAIAGFPAIVKEIATLTPLVFYGGHVKFCPCVCFCLITYLVA
ncbi:hypothetical protein CDAR_224791 [Caerostris darwini]|uniref:Uncharacterized protein n=1 Tax=Caerostris darwini TaxID=1538125 RepID=A0AAV4N9Z2_9ARAC|nr:hypothetical protein CDAR_224791 [Caerostris darwini]